MDWIFYFFLLGVHDTFYNGFICEKFKFYFLNSERFLIHYSFCFLLSSPSTILTCLCFSFLPLPNRSFLTICIFLYYHQRLNIFVVARDIFKKQPFLHRFGRASFKHGGSKHLLFRAKIEDSLSKTIVFGSCEPCQSFPDMGTF